MTLKIQKWTAVLCSLILLALLATSCTKDPNVKAKEGQKNEYNVDMNSSETTETELPGFHSYGTGKTEPVTVGGVSINVKSYAVRSYELAYMMGQKEFSSPNQLSVDVLTQYGFSHVLLPNLNETTNKTMEYRTATLEQIQAELQKLFGTVDADLTKAELYKPSEKIFEMWMPDYGCNIYYTIDAVNVEGNKADIITTFYNELARSTMLGRTTLTVTVQNGAAAISALKTE